MPCPLLASCIVLCISLRSCYALPGTEAGYGAIGGGHDQRPLLGRHSRELTLTWWRSVFTDGILPPSSSLAFPPSSSPPSIPLSSSSFLPLSFTSSPLLLLAPPPPTPPSLLFLPPSFLPHPSLSPPPTRALPPPSSSQVLVSPLLDLTQQEWLVPEHSSGPTVPVTSSSSFVTLAMQHPDWHPDMYVTEEAVAAFLEDKLCASRRLPHSGLLLPPLPSLPSLLDRAGYPRFGLQSPVPARLGSYASATRNPVPARLHCYAVGRTRQATLLCSSL
eukprot:1435879-Rhodomonas_salina.1